MFETLEDFVELSLNLNYKAYPFLDNLHEALLAENEQTVQVHKGELEELLSELLSFLETVEASKDDEGNINIYEFEDRKIH